MATYTIRVATGAASGASVTFSSGALLIGSDASCNLVVEDPKVSRFHARLTASDGYVVLDDLQSANGTMVNGARVTRTVLVSGDTISIGDTEIGFAEEADAAQPAQVPQTPPDRTPPPTAQTSRTPTRGGSIRGKGRRRRLWLRFRKRRRLRRRRKRRRLRRRRKRQPRKRRSVRLAARLDGNGGLRNGARAYRRLRPRSRRAGPT